MTIGQCAHTWGAEFHTHLGHEKYGSHSAHWDCLECGATKNFELGIARESVYPPSNDLHTRALPMPHECFAGWRSVVLYHAYFDGERHERSLDLEPGLGAQMFDGAKPWPLWRRLLHPTRKSV